MAGLLKTLLKHFSRVVVESMAIWMEIFYSKFHDISQDLTISSVFEKFHQAELCNKDSTTYWEL